MAAKPLSMNKIRQIIRMRKEKESLSFIAESVKASRNSVKKYLRILETKSITLEQALAMSDPELSSLFHPPDYKDEQRYHQLEDFFPYMKKELNKTGVTRWILWGEYIKLHPGGYRYSNFTHHYRNWLKSNSATLHIEQEPADKMYIDYAGKKLLITDKQTGKTKEVEVYVSVLGYSQLTYVEARESQQKEDFIQATENALRYYGGVPKALVPDNLKSAVKKASKYEAELNESFLDFANHYGCSVLAARARKPRDKSLVEKAVSIIYTRIYAPLRNQKFHSLAELNNVIGKLLEEHNRAKFQQKDFSRRESYEKHEKHLLKELPLQKFEIKEFSELTLQKNCHILLQNKEQKHYYSAPYRYIGKKLKIVYSSADVAIYYKHDRIAYHLRKLSFGYSTIKEHLPSTHQFVSDWNPQKFINWASKVSPIVKDYIVQILKGKKYPEQSYRSCVGILSYDKRVGRERLIKACERAAYFGSYSYKVIQTIIEGKLDKQNYKEEQPGQADVPNHKNIRGKNNYK